jgi:hypothetical protein
MLCWDIGGLCATPVGPVATLQNRADGEGRGPANPGGGDLVSASCISLFFWRRLFCAVLSGVGRLRMLDADACRSGSNGWVT